MDILNQIIRHWSKDEVRAFKVFTNRTNQTVNNKSEVLFDYIRKAGEDYNEDSIFKKLYTSSNKNAFYRLKNNLLTEISKHLLASTYQSSTTINIHELLSLVDHFKSRNQFTVAHYFLKKAEKEAIKTQDVALISMIYHHFIKLSIELTFINPNEYIQKQRELKEELETIEKIDFLLLPFIHKMKLSQAFSKDTALSNELETIIDRLNTDKSIQKSYGLRVRIYKALSSILLQKNAFEQLFEYASQTFQAFEKEKLFRKENHDLKLEMIIYIVNAAFKINRLSESLNWADILHQNMKAFNEIYYKKYQHFYYSALMYSYSQLDLNKAIELAIFLKKETWIKNTGIYEVFISANLSTFYFQSKEYQKAIKNLNELYINPKYKQADESFKLKLNISELIIWMEMEKIDTLNYRMKQVKNDFKHVLLEEINAREVKILEILHLAPIAKDVRDKVKLKKITSDYLLKEKPNTEGTINYYSWIKSKFKM